MTQQDLDKIRQLATDQELTPRPQAWARLSEGLGHKRTKVQLSFYQKLSVAAAFIAVLSVGALFQHMTSEHHDPEVFASNEEFKPLVLEELVETTAATIYSVSDVQSLSNNDMPKRFFQY